MDLLAASDLTTWKTLFGFSSDEAAKAIRNWRADFTRQTISQATWLLVKEARMAEGFNKESYEHSLWRAKAARKPHSQTSNGTTVKADEAKYLVKLECDSLPSMESVDLMRFLPQKPNMLSGLDDDGNVMTPFFLLSSSQKGRLSVKDLSMTSYPTLGVDTTLPQFRPDSSSSLSFARPAQDEYPVWYLADANVRPLSSDRPG
ncbi:hypothetical protein CCMA1212_002628 [Trichoderma ghanense]|uniref:Uncharacterized protein n=1 Tax=Trichoderma ghanense TaxID=65468 RepID=A0ABY2HCY0_9HYPO